MINEVAIFILGMLASLIAIMLYEVGKRPSLRISVGETSDGQKSNLLPFRFVHAKVENRPVKWPWKIITDRQVAWGCQARIEVYYAGTRERAIKEDIIARWSGTPEIVQPVAISTSQGPVTFHVPDITKLPQGRRMDVLPGQKEEIDIALKFEGELECYIFSNESYLMPNPTPQSMWRNPNWRLQQGIYEIVVKIFSGSLKKEKHFLLKNQGTSRSDMVLEEIPSRLDKFKSFYCGFKSVRTALILFFLINVFLYLLTYLRPTLLDFLSLSTNKPWGILTSTFIHRDLDHLARNLFWFVIWGMLFVTTNMFVKIETRRRSSKIFLWMIFTSGFLANAFLFFRWRLQDISTNALGASGVVYASAGVLMASALHNFQCSCKDLFKDKTAELKLKLAKLCLSIFIVIILFLCITKDPKAFLGTAPNVNVFVHGYGFLFGLFLYWPSFYFTSLRNWLKSKKLIRRLKRIKGIRVEYPTDRGDWDEA